MITLIKVLRISLYRAASVALWAVIILTAANELGIRISYKGEGLNEVGIVESIDSEKKYAIKKGDIIVNIDRRYFRPAEVETLLGDSKLAKDELNWTPKISAQELCKEMIEEDLKKILNK